MARDKYYCQCRLHKKTKTGVIIDTAWIPEKYARVEKHIRVKIDDEWDPDWYVVCVWGKKEEKELAASERDYLKQREVSDV
jgi:hypothetical protein